MDGINNQEAIPPQPQPETKKEIPSGIEFGDGVEDYFKNNQYGVVFKGSGLTLGDMEVMGSHCLGIGLEPRDGETIKLEMAGEDILKMTRTKVGEETKTSIVNKGILEGFYNRK